MRFALALIAFVVAAGLIAVGVAERTFLLPANHTTISATVDRGAHYVVVPGELLTAHPGQQHVRITGQGDVFAAYGRSSDVVAWLSGERYEQLATTSGSATAASRSLTAPVVAGLQGGSLPNPDGSDLWLDQRRAAKVVDWTVNVPADVSLLVASNGRAAAPAAVTLSWPVHVSTPFATPLIVTGSVLLLVGLLLYIWALVDLRRRRGPRRKAPPRMPKLPQPPKYKPARVIAPGSSRGRRSVRRMVAAGAGIASIAALTGCSTAPVAARGVSTPVSHVVAVTPAALTEGQAARIVLAAAAVANRADASLDAKLLATRFSGPALALRSAAYAAHAKSKKVPLPEAIPSTDAEVQVTLPQATPGWPRLLFSVVTDRRDAKAAPIALTLLQQTPRSEYEVEYATALQTGAAVPALPAPSVGSSRLAVATPLLRVSPAALAADYGLLLRKAGVPQAALFDTSHDQLLREVGVAAKKKAARALGSTAKIVFSDATTDPTGIIAFATAGSGALVAVTLEETWTVKPVKSGVTVKPSGATKILSGVSSTKKGIASVYAYQLLFSVPSVGRDSPVTLLGYAQGLVSAKEL